MLEGDSITRAAGQERFSREKNDDRFPAEAIGYCLEDVAATDLDGVAVASLDSSFWAHLRRKARWSIDDYLAEQHEYWYPKLLMGESIAEKGTLDHLSDFDQYPQEYWANHCDDADLSAQFAADRTHIFADFLGIDERKVTLIEHHRCHAFHGYCSCPFKGEPVLVLTIDGWGDGRNATINVFDENGDCNRVFETANANIGRIYRYMTLLLGMKPNEHEYKVMGLAPYGKQAITQKAYDLFRSTLYVDGLDFGWQEKPTDSYFWFKERLEGCRFDGIAAGLQQWTEELLCEWVGNAVRELGIRNVVISGGVAQNIKANGRIVELDCIEKLFVPGAPSDGSLSIGAACALQQDLLRAAGGSSAPCVSVRGLNLGPVNTFEAEAVAIEAANMDCDVVTDFSAADVAQLLADGKIVARCAGRMEFGPRALGNRSILADPSDTGVVPRINHAIKNRDFWMPFAPVILDTWQTRYLINGKGIDSPYMTIGFETTDLAQQHLPAGCHPADHSARPQILRREDNSALYEIMCEFEKATGRGALLNTSFNLHGFPIVNTPAEAMDVFCRSGLDVLVLNHFMVVKR